MSIELQCGQCDRTLRLPDDAAGKQARCPECRYIFPVPTNEASARPAAEVEQWYAKIEDGRSYGPVLKSELNQWLADGRITPDTQLRREGTDQWMAAGEVYPVLRKDGPKPSQNPFADVDVAMSDNPYASPTSGRARLRPFGARGRTMPHRGGLILALGIFAILFNYCTCLILGVCAWYMGNDDLNAMRSGRMDSGGYGLTQAGMILGIIATILHGLILFAQMFGVR